MVYSNEYIIKSAREFIHLINANWDDKNREFEKQYSRWLEKHGFLMFSAGWQAILDANKRPYGSMGRFYWYHQFPYPEHPESNLSSFISKELYMEDKLGFLPINSYYEALSKLVILWCKDKLSDIPDIPEGA